MAETYNVYFGTTPAGLERLVSGISELSTVVVGIPLAYSTTYYWRVDATNENGTTTGDVWSFTTLAYDQPQSSARYKSDKSVVPMGTAFDPDTMYYTGENFIGGSVRRLVAAANNAIWYEAIEA